MDHDTSQLGQPKSQLPSRPIRRKESAIDASHNHPVYAFSPARQMPAPQRVRRAEPVEKTFKGRSQQPHAGHQEAKMQECKKQCN